MSSVVHAVSTCPHRHRDAALRVLHEGLPPAKQAELVVALRTTPLDDPSVWDGLLIAGHAERPESAVWVQRMAGNTGVLWPPALEARSAIPLYQAVSEFARSCKIPLVQLLVGENDPIHAEGLAVGGFQRLARLAYMAADVRPAAEASSLEFEAGAGRNPQRLAAVIQQTFHKTLDCPQLDGVRSLSDAIVGYRAQGAHLPQHWYFVRVDNDDAGVLLLTSHPAAGNWELVYMGVRPEYRGRGLGRQIVEFAVGAAHGGGARQVVLAVDAQNDPALQVYMSSGFRIWDHQLVYARLSP